MADAMALFEAEIEKMDSLADDKCEGEKQEVVAKGSHTDDVKEKEIEETAEAKPKISLVAEAKRAWKQRQISEIAAEAAAWIEHKDAVSGCSYYYNNITKASAWTLPPDAKAPKWTVAPDAASGHLYYHDNESGESTWERPVELVKKISAAAEATAAEKEPSSAAEAAATADLDEVIDLAEGAEERVFARVAAESEDGVSVIGFHMRLDTPFGKLMAAWSDFQELPVDSIYFELGGVLLDPGETPESYEWTRERGPLQIEAKPCEEVEEEEEPMELSERDIAKLKRKALEDEVSERVKKREQKERRLDLQSHKEEQQLQKMRQAQQ